MTMRITSTRADRLHDEALLIHLRDTIAAAQSRPALKPALRQLLAEALSEEKAEMLAGSALSAEDIADLSRIDADGLMHPAEAVIS